MPNVSNPDDDLMKAQQERDLRHATTSQPERAKNRERETAGDRIETDLISGDGIGAAAFSELRESETEAALERARKRAREQVPAGRRR